jgi:hypothetical protein
MTIRSRFYNKIEQEAEKVREELKANTTERIKLEAKLRSFNDAMAWYLNTRSKKKNVGTKSTTGSSANSAP